MTVNQTGDRETFYTHALFYQVGFAKSLYSKYKTGLGTFIMQGFEHRNKQSKNVYDNHTNGKGNICVQGLKH